MKSYKNGARAQANGRAPFLFEYSDAISPEEEKKRAFSKVLRLVKVRDRSVSEVRKRLLRDGFSEAATDDAVSRCIQLRFLDDARFAEVFVRSRLRAGKGLSGIVRELRSHGINPSELLPRFPEAYLEGAPNQEDAAYALLCRKPPHSKNQIQAAYAKLVRAGYSMALAQEVAKRWYSEQVGVSEK